MAEQDQQNTTTTPAPAGSATVNDPALETVTRERTGSPVFIQGGAERGQSVGSQVASNLTDPQIPEQAIQTATLIEEQPGEIAGGFAQTTDPTVQAAVAEAAQQADAQQIQAQTVSGDDLATVGQGAEAQAATAVLPQELTTSGQLERLLTDTDEEGIPEFAKPAVAAVDRMLAQRGLTRSSIGQEQLMNAIITQAIPLAQADSNALVQNFSQNLNNEQQAAMASAGFRQQAMLSDQAAMNASLQFNAQSQAQTDQFMASLRNTIEKSNADRITATSQFNAQQENAMQQFSKQVEFNRDQFNTQNAIAIEQSNVTWRREMNKINTAATNAVNQANAMNAFNLSNQALTFMWQEMRDAAKWSFEASQNEKQRQAALAQAALGNEAASDSKNQASIAALGQAAMNLWAKYID